MTLPQYRLDIPIEQALGRNGVAVQHFPAYTNQALDLHTHGFLEMNLVLKGTPVHYLEDHIIRERPGALGIVHHGQNHDILTPDGPAEVINLYFDLARYRQPALPRALAGYLSSILPPGQTLAHRLNRLVHLDLASDIKAQGYLLHAWREQQTDTDAGDFAVQRLVELFLLACCRASEQHGLTILKPAEGTYMPRMEDVRLSIHEHARSPDLTLAFLARRFGMNKSYLSRQFKTYTGVTVTTYINQRRVEYAMSCLRASREKIVVIALESGFQDLSHFNRVFRKHAGMTPGAYRRGPDGEATM